MPIGSIIAREPRVCERCGCEVSHEQTQISGHAPFWSAQEHTAPCGLPCAGGGLRRPREPAHGRTHEPCPNEKCERRV